MGRAPCCDKATVKRGPWSEEEDARLRSYIHQHGTGGNWIALPRKVGLRRCGKSCRLRWLNYLRPDIRHGGFSEEEDRVICGLYAAIGSRWSLIAAQLPGRTDNDVKNYWNTRLKKKLLGAVTNAGNGNPPSIIKSPLLQLHGHDHYAANVNDAALSLMPLPHLLSWNGQPYGTTGSSGSGVNMHVGVGAGEGGSIGMSTTVTNAAAVASHGYDAFAANEPAANTSYSCATTPATELDEIFRSIGGGDLSHCTDALLNWCQQGEGVQQQHLGMPYR